MMDENLVTNLTRKLTLFSLYKQRVICFCFFATTECPLTCTSTANKCKHTRGCRQILKTSVKTNSNDQNLFSIQLMSSNKICLSSCLLSGFQQIKETEAVCFVILTPAAVLKATCSSVLSSSGGQGDCGGLFQGWTVLCPHSVLNAP